jgi:hypothetical protein
MHTISCVGGTASESVDLQVPATQYLLRRSRRTVKWLNKRIGLPFQIRVHMLRHACGYAYAWPMPNA